MAEQRHFDFFFEEIGWGTWIRSKTKCCPKDAENRGFGAANRGSGPRWWPMVKLTTKGGTAELI
jgi:hypothetical protein